MAAARPVWVSRWRRGPRPHPNRREASCRPLDRSATIGPAPARSAEGPPPRGEESRRHSAAAHPRAAEPTPFGRSVLRNRRRSTVLATLSVLTLITVAACGGDDDDGHHRHQPPGPTPCHDTEAASTTTSTETDARPSRAPPRRRRAASATTDAGPATSSPPTVARASTTSRGRGRAGQGRHARVRPRGRHRQPVGAVPDELRDEPATSLLAAISRPVVRRHRRRRDRAAARRVGRAQRRLHASGRCTSATASSSRTARRSTAPP